MAKVIKISDASYYALRKLGAYGDTMDSIVANLLASSKSKSNKAHAQVEHKRKTYDCEKCSESFATEDDLSIHDTKMH